MKSILSVVEDTVEIKRSTFHTILYPVKFVKDVEHALAAVKKQYPDANHHCYAYIIGENQEIQKYEDDGEPSQTAGMPILEVLKKNDLTNVLAIVVRYFGGIKLGAGGLIRAYSKGPAEAIKIAKLASRETMMLIEIKAKFDDIGKFEPFVREIGVLKDTVYKDYVVYYVEIKADQLDGITPKIRVLSQGDSYPEVVETYTTYR